MAAFDAKAEARSTLGDADRPVKYELNRRRLVSRASARREKMIAFGYYGGKFSHLDFIHRILIERVDRRLDAQNDA